MKLSEREWTVLNALWETEGAELGTLVNELYKNTGWSRNTVLTYLTRMEAKGLVRIDKDTYPHTYHATLDRDRCGDKYLCQSVLTLLLPCGLNRLEPCYGSNLYFYIIH